MEESKQTDIREQHSVDISINAKGQYSAKAKCYGLTPDEAMARTLALANQLEALIASKNQ